MTTSKEVRAQNLDASFVTPIGELLGEGTGPKGGNPGENIGKLLINRSLNGKCGIDKEALFEGLR